MEINKFIDENLAKGFICPLKSSQILLVFFMTKKDGGKCLVMDYRYLNQGIIKNNYPLPLISQLIDKMKGYNLFIKMDLKWGYNNIQIHTGNE